MQLSRPASGNVLLCIPEAKFVAVWDRCRAVLFTSRLFGFDTEKSKKEDARGDFRVNEEMSEIVQGRTSYLYLQLRASWCARELGVDRNRDRRSNCCSAWVSTPVRNSMPATSAFAGIKTSKLRRWVSVSS